MIFQRSDWLFSEPFTDWPRPTANQRQNPFKLWDGTAENVLVENIRTKIDNREILPPGDEKNVDFISNPKIVEFKNYYLKKSYSKNIMLTNVSSLTSNIRLVEISNEIKDVCSLDFTPCPPLSPGMSANFKLTFRPTNADAIINGRLVFQTQSGLLEIPVKCCPPMIEPKLVTEELDFGREVLGETIIKNIKIINEGQLSGQFKLSRVFKSPSLIG